MHTLDTDNPIRAPRAEDGMALLWALLFVIVTSGMVVSHTAYMAARRGERDTRYNRASIADTFARSGLQDAVGWFHRDGNHPVTMFDPVYDPTGNPPRIETIDPTIGLVREFEINGNLWGRYEVRKDEAFDISKQRGDLVPGSVWELGVRAYVYRVKDATKPFDKAPNELVATKSLSSEIRGIQLNPPAPAALCVDDCAQIQVGRRATIEGATSIAIAFLDPATVTDPTATEPTVDSSAVVTGLPAQLAAPSYNARPTRVFAMRIDELRAYSDAVIDGGASANSNSFFDFLRSLFDPHYDGPDGTPATPTITGKVVYTEDLKLGGNMVLQNVLLIVDGNLTDDMIHDTKIDGVVYVTGDATLDSGKLELNGQLIVRGKARIGTGFGQTKLRYDADVVRDLRRIVGKYRTRRGRSPGR